MTNTNLDFRYGFNDLCDLLRDYDLLSKYDFEIDDDMFFIWEKGKARQYFSATINITDDSIYCTAYYGTVGDAIVEPIFSFNKFCNFILMMNNKSLAGSSSFFDGAYHFAVHDDVLKYGFKDPYNIPDEILESPIIYGGSFPVKYGVSKRTLAKFIEGFLSRAVMKDHIFKDPLMNKRFFDDFINSAS